eukprot:886506-Heterocapsa_arctica.AAC.1
MMPSTATFPLSDSLKRTMSSTRSMSSCPSSFTSTFIMYFRKCTANPHPANTPPFAGTSSLLALCT